MIYTGLDKVVAWLSSKKVSEKILQQLKLSKYNFRMNKKIISK